MSATDFDQEECLAQAKELVNEFKLILPKQVDAASLSLKSKLPFKAVPLREVLLYRITELADSACILYEQEKVVSAFVMTRSLMETVAMLYWLYGKINRVVSSNELGEIDNFLMRATFGGREIPEPMTAFNVLDAIDEMTKQFSGYRKLYDRLSEIAHPNWLGVHGAYAQTDTKKHIEYLGSECSHLTLVTGVVPLLASLKASKFYYDKLTELFPLFIKVCDADVDRTSRRGS
jgi:hypothetical protein